MVVGLGITLLHMVGSRFYGMSWWGTDRGLGLRIPLVFLNTWVVSSSPRLHRSGSRSW